MSQPEWPEPAPDPPSEPHESRYGLLPSLERLRGMDRTTLLELREQVADWVGPVVEEWRQALESRLSDDT